MRAGARKKLRTAANRIQIERVCRTVWAAAGVGGTRMPNRGPDDGEQSLRPWRAWLEKLASGCFSASWFSSAASSRTEQETEGQRGRALCKRRLKVRVGSPEQGRWVAWTRGVARCGSNVVSALGAGCGHPTVVFCERQHICGDLLSSVAEVLVSVQHAPDGT